MKPQLIRFVFCLFGVLLFSETFGATLVGHGDENLASRPPLMALPGQSDVDANGNFNYAVPIDTPSGTAGIVPALSLRYSSEAGDGFEGLGWSLDIDVERKSGSHRDDRMQTGWSSALGISSTSDSNGVSQQMDGQIDSARAQSGESAGPEFMQITRCPRTLAQDAIHGSVNYDPDSTGTGTNDRFCIAGKRLILISSGATYGADSTQYRTEIEEFSKIVAHGHSGNGPVWFELHTRSGQTLQFGNSTDSRAPVVAVNCGSPAPPACTAGTVRSWALNKVLDTKGNYFTVTYNNGTPDTTNGQIYPTEIDYTANDAAGVAAYNSVRFVYATRNDQVPNYQAGAVVTMNLLLADIQTYLGTRSSGSTTLVSDYHIGYTLAQPNAAQRNELTTITRCNTANCQANCPAPNCLPTLTFGWQGTRDQLQFNSVPSPLPAMPGTSVQFGDFNGDGLMDAIYSGSSIPKCTFILYLAQENGSFAQQQTTTSNMPCSGDSDFHDGITWQIGGVGIVALPDINGDGLPDIAVQYSEQAFVNDKFLTSSSYKMGFWDGVSNFSGVNWGHTTPYTFGDFNGDIYADVLVFFGSFTDILFGVGNGTFISGPSNVGAGTYFFSVGDFDGSGCSSVYYGNPGTTTGTLYYMCSPAVSMGSAPYVVLSRGHQFFADFNGDGKTDLLVIGSTSSTLYLSTGTGFVPTAFSTPTSWAYGVSSESIITGEFRGDGKAGLVIPQSDGSSEIWLSTGTGFAKATTIPAPSNLGSPAIYRNVSDLNSDGASDIQYTYTNSNSQNQPLFQLLPYTPELIATVSNGIGSTLTVAYDRLNKNSTVEPNASQPFFTRSTGSTYPTRDVDGPIYVVAELDKSNGLGACIPPSTANCLTTLYSYAGDKTNLLGRGSLGFSQITKTDLSTGVVTTTNYLQAYPCTGLIASETVVAPGTGGPVTIKSTQNTYNIVSIAGGVNFSCTSIPSGVGATAPYFVERQSRVVSRSDLNGTAFPTITTNFTYDCDVSGNPCSGVSPSGFGEIVQSSLTRSTDNSTEVVNNTYNDSATNWFLNQLTQSVETRTVGASQITRTTGHGYDASSGLLTSTTIEPGNSALQLVTGYTLDAFGNRIQTSVSGANIASRSSSASYDSLGEFQTSVTDAYGHVDRYTHDARFGGLTGQTDVNGLVTTWSYDTFGRETNETRPDGTETLTAYVYCLGVNGGSASCPSNGAYFAQATQMASNGTTQIGPTGTTHYDSLDRRIATDTQGFDGSTIRASTPYDALGRIAQTSRPYFLGGTPQWTIFTYDALGRPTRANAPNGEVTTTAYNGLAASVTNTDNTNIASETTTTTMNAEGQIASVMDALNNTTRYSYDAFDDLTQITDIAGNITQYSYDLRGHKLTAQDPDLGNWQYGYDALGELTSQIDANSNYVTLSYDLEQRLVNRVEPDLNSSWNYGTATPAIDKLTSATTAAGYQQALTYDSLSRPTRTVLTVGGSNFTYTTGYNVQNGKIASIGYPSGFGINYAYTSLGYLSQINDATTNQSYWTVSQRDAGLHPTSQSFGNGVAETNTYDATTGLLTNVRAGASNAIAQFDYQYDLLGNLIYRSDDYQGIFEDYCFDALNRLTNSATGTTGAGISSCTVSGANISDKVIGYDALGDITSKSDVGTYVYPATGQARPHAVASITGTVNGVVNPTFAYDNNGNMTSGDGRTVTYSSFNMADQITEGTTTIAFTYDSEHARITQVGPAGTTTYANDPASGAMAEQVVNGSTTNWHDYVLVPGSESDAGAFLVEHLGVGSAGTPTNWGSANWGSFTWSGAASSMLYFTADHLGSIAVVADQTGNPMTAERDSYDAWGKRRNATGTDNTACSVTSETTRGFTHQEQMDSVCLINFNARVYDPTLGRFMAADPITAMPYDPQSLSRYTYVGNRPLDLTDPTGMDTDGVGGEFSVNLGPAYYSLSFGTYFDDKGGVALYGATGHGRGFNSKQIRDAIARAFKKGGFKAIFKLFALSSTITATHSNADTVHGMSDAFENKNDELGLVFGVTRSEFSGTYEGRAVHGTTYGAGAVDGYSHNDTTTYTKLLVTNPPLSENADAKGKPTQNGNRPKCQIHDACQE